jgi:glycosyltransferase involved in cell wall biosynthesis
MFYALERQPRSDRRFRLVYTGTLSLSETNRSIAGFLAALQELLMAGHPLMHDLQIELVGSLAAAEQTAIRQAGLAPYFTYTGSVPYRTALQHQLDADVLLLVTASTATSVTTSKLFEYLASARPILALTGRSAAAEVIRELDAGVVVEPNDPAAIKQALIGLHQRWQAGTLSSQQDPRVARFSRPHLTEQLAGAFDQLLGERP